MNKKKVKCCKVKVKFLGEWKDNKELPDHSFKVFVCPKCGTVIQKFTKKYMVVRVSTFGSVERKVLSV